MRRAPIAAPAETARQRAVLPSHRSFVAFFVHTQCHEDARGEEAADSRASTAALHRPPPRALLPSVPLEATSPPRAPPCSIVLTWSVKSCSFAMNTWLARWTRLEQALWCALSDRFCARIISLPLSPAASQCTSPARTRTRLPPSHAFTPPH